MTPATTTTPTTADACALCDDAYRVGEWAVPSTTGPESAHYACLSDAATNAGLSGWHRTPAGRTAAAAAVEVVK